MKAECTRRLERTRHRLAEKVTECAEWKSRFDRILTILMAKLED